MAAPDAGQTGGRQGRTESQDPQAAAKRAEHPTGTSSPREVRVRSNYQTPLGDAAAAADAGERKASGRSSP
jgi:hypothetical protein